MQLQDVDTFFDAIGRWATQHPVIGFAVMGFMGGIVAVLRMYERVGIKFTFPGFIARCAVKGVIGMFVACSVFFGWRAMAFSQDWGYLGAAVCGVWGTEVLEAIFVMAIEVLRKRAGLTPVPVVAVKPAEPSG